MSNTYLVCEDDEHVNAAKGAKQINGFEYYYNLEEAVSSAILYAKNSMCNFIIQPNSPTANVDDGMVLVYYVTPKSNSVRRIIV